MNKPILLSDEARKVVINNVFLQTGIFPQIIEKDLWVTTVLQLIFSFSFADKLVFKGGTSLSKVWNVIQRFSEDIDITVDRDTIRHHREKFTHISSVDYSQDIRPNICLIPPKQVIDDWRQDYETMQRTMIYGKSPAFDELINRIKQLEERIRQAITGAQ